MYTHVVLFHLVDPSEAQAVAERLVQMRGRIPGLRQIEAGADDAPSERSADVCLITRFDDAAGLADYQVHPVHQELLAWIRPKLKGAVKVDYPG
jgi:hypothetical protein